MPGRLVDFRRGPKKRQQMAAGGGVECLSVIIAASAALPRSDSSMMWSERYEPNEIGFDLSPRRVGDVQSGGRSAIVPRSNAEEDWP